MLSFIKTTFGELMKRRNCAKRSANRQIERAKESESPDLTAATKQGDAPVGLDDCGVPQALLSILPGASALLAGIIAKLERTCHTLFVLVGRLCNRTISSR
jgi:hypothetical protein